MNDSRLLFGLGLVALGVLWVLDLAGALELGPVVADWWPLAIVAVGAVQLLDRPPRTSSAVITMAIGMLLLGFTTGVLRPSLLQLLWPLALVALGLWMIIGRRRVPVATADDALSALVAFSGRDITNRSQAFRGGSLTSLFGGIQVNLQGARLHPDGALLDVTCAFGGVQLVVPDGWRVRMRGPAIFGGYSNRAASAPAPTPEGTDPGGAPPVLDVRCFVLFGGAEVNPASRAARR